MNRKKILIIVIAVVAVCVICVNLIFIMNGDDKSNVEDISLVKKDKTGINADKAVEKKPSLDAKENKKKMSSPPGLTVMNLDESTEATQGTCSWTIPLEDGKYKSTEADSDHVLCLKEYMEPLNLIPTTKSSVDPKAGYLKWEDDRKPSSVTVKCWGEEYWGNIENVPKGETVEVKALSEEDLSNGASYRIELKDGNYLYEIHAYFASSGDLGFGDVYYGFYTSGLQFDLII
ncbi:MAG: hypothetical protein K6F93_06240 [Lachnospiraceae bacterium]|nr:hypothetical protein [Lachnospiraceae bacterium]